MSPRLALFLLAAGPAVAGCASSSESTQERLRTDQSIVVEADRMLVESALDDQVAQGIRRSRAVFPHHFSPESARLTTAGRRVLDVLGPSLSRDGGRISVRRGAVSESLYGARVEAVQEGLIARGVELDRIVLDDGPPGGPGVSSRRAVIIATEIQLSRISVPSGSTLSPQGGSTEVNR